jgi:4-amino-4-deoxy-L-arabinose transferase-like glycosyltransferase
VQVATSRAPWRGKRVDLTVAIAAAITLVFFVISAWWVAVDRAVPDFDSGRHLFFAFTARDALHSGDLGYSFSTFNNYPPGVHLLGGIAALIGGVRIAPPVIAQNLVYLPLLAAGCYGVGRLAYGSLAGLLAVVFALGTPMLISQLHVFMLDAPEAAMVAVSVWAILASDRFARPGISAIAGLLCAIGMLTKQTFPIFVGGVIIVALLRGGWRNWRGLMAFAVVLAVVGAPWYLAHLDDLRRLTLGAAGGGGAGGGGAGHNQSGGVTPDRWSRKNFGWYFWNLVNLQLLLPLAAFALAGTAICLVRFVRNRQSADLTPELFVGALCAYLGETYISLKDPRYTLPALVYMAVLGTGWIAPLRTRLRIAVVAVLAAIAILNTIAVSFGAGHDVRVLLAGAPRNSGLHERAFTLYSPAGYVRGGPERSPDVLAIMRGLRARGVEVIDFDGGSANVPAFNLEGLRTLARIAGLRQPAVYAPQKLMPRDAFLVRRTPVAGDPPPCGRFQDGSGLYAELGNPVKPFADYTLVCPGRHPAIYRRTAPSPDDIRGRPRRDLLHMMRALKRRGVRVIEFDVGSAGNRDFGIAGLTALAQEAGLRRPKAYNPAALGPRDAFVLRHVTQPGEPAPCVRLADGAGAYVVLGNPVMTFDQYHFICPRR